MLSGCSFLSPLLGRMAETSASISHPGNPDTVVCSGVRAMRCATLLSAAWSVPETHLGRHERSARLRVKPVLDGISTDVDGDQKSSSPSQPLSMAMRLQREPPLPGHHHCCGGGGSPCHARARAHARCPPYAAAGPAAAFPGSPPPEQHLLSNQASPHLQNQLSLIMQQALKSNS